MNLIYNFDLDTPDELLEILARNLQQRRLEKGSSRNTLSKLSGVLTPIQKQNIVGCSVLGALCYLTETYIGEDKNRPELDELQQMALDVLSEKSDKGEDTLYFNSGNSGGCRPKCLLHDEPSKIRLLLEKAFVSPERED